MTDRLASCRDSPNGKHDRMAYTLNGKTACRYCGREGKVSAILPGIAWQLKKSHIPRGVPPSSPLAMGAGQTGEIITTSGWSVIDEDVED